MDKHVCLVLCFKTMTFTSCFASQTQATRRWHTAFHVTQWNAIWNTLIWIMSNRTIHTLVLCRVHDPGCYSSAKAHLSHLKYLRVLTLTAYCSALQT
uniref:Secreted protein n=1 Tax=Anguilla anguilla TaxID=7936 RepID=A0A0E9X2C7_ANGAN